MKVPRKYGLVRVIAFILKLLAWIALIICVAGAIFGITLFNRPTPFLSPSILGTSTLVGAILIGLLWFIPLYAFGSVLTLLLDIEENTRTLATEGPALETDRA